MADVLDPNSATWRIVRAALERARDEGQPRVNDRTTTLDETNFLRGQIALATEILTLGEPPGERAAREQRARDSSGYR